jgi:hypothetical protein
VCGTLNFKIKIEEKLNSYFGSIATMESSSGASSKEARVSNLDRRLRQAERCEHCQEREVIQQSLRRTYLILVVFFLLDIVWHHLVIFEGSSMTRMKSLNSFLSRNWKPIFLSEKLENTSTQDEFLIEFEKLLSIGEDHENSGVEIDPLEVSVEVNDECLRLYRDYDKNYDICVITM